MGLLSRSATGFASSSAAGTAQRRLAGSRQAVDSDLMDRNDSLVQFGMDFLPRQLSGPGRSDVVGCFFTGKLRFARSERKPLSSCGSLGAGLRNCADDD